MKILQVQPSSATFEPNLRLLQLGEWVEDKAAIILKTSWSEKRLCILLWAVSDRRTAAVNPLFEVVLASEEKILATISAAVRPDYLFQGKAVRLGDGMRHQRIVVEPTVVFGLDMFSIDVVVHK